MTTLLVVDRDDCYLPKGWVSAILPEGAAPSEYERSGYLWKAVEVPAETVKKVVLTGGFDVSLRSLIFNQGSIGVHDSAAEVLKIRQSVTPSLKPALGPVHLDRSHSTVWDYGPGRTYSTPQAAFDALMAQEGSNEFTETHYIRGWSGTYFQDISTAVLGLHTVAPTASHPLVVDAEAGENVVFNDEGGPVCVAGSEVNHVWVRSLKLVGASVGVVPQALEAGAVVEDWLVEGCEADGSEYEIANGIFIYKADRLRVRKSFFHHLNSGVAGIAAWFADYSTRVEVSGCRIMNANLGIFTNASTTLLVFNNTVEAEIAGISHERAVPLTLAGMINNIFTAGHEDFNCLQTIEAPADRVLVMRSDANCFHPGTGGAVADLGGVELDLPGWREQFHQDDFSIEADPRLDEDLTLLPSSPCRGAGVCWDVVGSSGGRRSESIDMGADQATRPKVPGVSVRRRPEIGRR